MKTKYLFLIAISFFVASLISCQKDFTIDNITNRTDSTVNPPVGLDSNYLDKIVQYDTTSNNTIDSTTQIFKYDANKRLINITEKFVVNNVVDSGIFLKFFYNGNDSLPFKATADNDSFKLFFFYDLSGKLIKDSLINVDVSYSNDHVTNFSYSNNKIFANSVSHYSPSFPTGVSILNKDTITTDASGNFLSSISYVNNTGVFQKTYLINNIFDSKISPYSKVSAYRMFILANQIPSEFPFAYAKNNLVREVLNNYQTIGGVTSLFYTSQRDFINSYYPNNFLKSHKTTGENYNYFYKAL